MRELLDTLARVCAQAAVSQYLVELARTKQEHVQTFCN